MVGYLRFVLAALVLYSHLNYPLWKLGGVRINQGVYAVFCFYLISGFFTAVIYDRFSGPKHLMEFYADRLLRIMPTFWVVMFSVLAISLLVRFEPSLGPGATDYRDPWYWFLAAVQPLNGILAFFYHGDYAFGPFFPFTPVASLALEVQYFVIAPLFFCLRPRSVVAVLLICSALTAYVGLTATPNELENQTYRDLVGVVPVFLLGFLFYRHLQDPGVWWPRFEWLGLAVGLAFFAVLLIGRPQSGKWLGEMALAVITCPWMLKLAMKRKSSRLDHLAGYASYGVFLAHIPVLRFLHLKGDSRLEFPLALAIATAIAIAIHFVIERPVLRWRHAMAERGVKEITT